MTPAENPRDASSVFLWNDNESQLCVRNIFPAKLTWLPFRKTTNPAPAAVNPHVNNVPSNACVTAPYPSIIAQGDQLNKFLKWEKDFLVKKGAKLIDRDVALRDSNENNSAERLELSTDICGNKKVCARQIFSTFALAVAAEQYLSRSRGGFEMRYEV